MNFLNFFFFLLILLNNAQKPEGVGGGGSTATQRLGGSRREEMMKVVNEKLSHMVEGANKLLNRAPDQLLEKWANQVSKKSLADLQNEFKAPVDVAPTAIFEANMPKNRYFNIRVIENTRVKLSDDKYIHANYIKKAGIKIICTQGPIGAGEIQTKSDTTGDFWQMVVEQKVDAIVMVTDTKEGDRTKCAQYWPLEKKDENHSTFGNYKIDFIRQNNFHGNIFKTELAVAEINKNGVVVKHNNVAHFHWRNWPDHGAPGDLESPLSLWNALLKDYKNVVVHCSAGIGRTGTIVAIQQGQQWMRTGKSLNILDLVEKLRKERAGSVQTLEQYLYIYNVFLNEAKQKADKKQIELKNLKAIENLIAQITNKITPKVP